MHPTCIVNIRDCTRSNAKVERKCPSRGRVKRTIRTRITHLLVTARRTNGVVEEKEEAEERRISDRIRCHQQQKIKSRVKRERTRSHDRTVVVVACKQIVIVIEPAIITTVIPEETVIKTQTRRHLTIRLICRTKRAWNDTTTTTTLLLNLPSSFEGNFESFLSVTMEMPSVLSHVTRADSMWISAYPPSWSEIEPCTEIQSLWRF